jgi:hypothetical protein
MVRRYLVLPPTPLGGVLFLVIVERRQLVRPGLDMTQGIFLGLDRDVAVVEDLTLEGRDRARRLVCRGTPQCLVDAFRTFPAERRGQPFEPPR